MLASRIYRRSFPKSEELHCLLRSVQIGIACYVATHSSEGNGSSGIQASKEKCVAHDLFVGLVWSKCLSILLLGLPAETQIGSGPLSQDPSPGAIDKEVGTQLEALLCPQLDAVHGLDLRWILIWTRKIPPLSPILKGLQASLASLQVFRGV